MTSTSRSLFSFTCPLIRWVRIKTIKYPPDPSPDRRLISGSNTQYTNDQEAVHQLIMALRDTHFEVIDREQAFTTLGLGVERESEWMAIISQHPLLFTVTQYRRKLVIERLIVELKLLSTDWVHLILKRKQDGIPMLQWLVERRHVAQLHDHYIAYMSRFDVIYSSLLSPRWIKLCKIDRMKGKPGFGYWASYSTFKETEYKADDMEIDTFWTDGVPGSVRRITITNERCMCYLDCLRSSDWLMS